MKITIIGTGYVGLVSGTCFSEFGHEVICIDKDSRKIRELQTGTVPIYEPGLQNLVQKNMQDNRLKFDTDARKAIPWADTIFIAVGTPSTRRGDGYADLSYIYEAAREIAPFITEYKLIVNKSTAPVGTARQIARIIRETNQKAEFDIASNPEFLREGAAINDFMRPDRVVIGVENDRAAELLRDIYKPLYLIETPIVQADIETAELIKYAANAFLAVKISYINEIASLCESLGADVITLVKAIGLDGRIGSKFLHPGPGYGGSCFPKDTIALIRMAQEQGTGARIVEAAVEVNAAQKARMIKKIRDSLGGNEAGKTIGILGLTFKPETDDMRDAPALTILPVLLEKGAKIQAHDPQGMDEARHYLPAGIEYKETPYQVCEGADIIVLMTEWNQYRALDLERIRSLMKKAVFVDLRNVYDPASMKALGFTYSGVGRS
jgi:UDPglucose 6-dehydrogenase